ncbi:MAG: transposase [Flavobacteriales bacterium]|jgi:REP element-mobilizing transposase RayT|nr:transposase [Flavobacteriales bacterium]
MQPLGPSRVAPILSPPGDHNTFYLGLRSEIRKANVDGALYFVTITVVGWVDVFTRKELAEEMIKQFAWSQKNKGLKLFAYVIMPSHIHFVAYRDEGLMSDLLPDLKSYSAKCLLKLVEDLPNESRRDWLLHMFEFHAKYQPQNEKYMFWQKTSHPTELWSDHVIDQKIRYIHMNPVVSNIVTDPEHYWMSSAYPEGRLKLNGYE